MATAYGAFYYPGYNAFRAIMSYSTSSSTATSLTISVTTSCNMGDGHDSGGNFTGYATIGGGTSSSTGGSTYYSAGGTYSMVSRSTTITKTHSAQSITVRGTVTSTGAWSGHSSAAAATITVPAKTSYKVTYNANGGSGAPSAQTKWHGETLKLSTTKPTRSNYEFLRWNTKSDGTGTNYSSGASYTGNVALTLYAVWKQAYVPPTISSLSAYRVNSNNVASDDGEYCHVTCTWAAGALSGSTISGDKLTIRYKLTTESNYTTANVVTLSGGSGTADVIVSSGSPVPFNLEKSYSVQVTVSDDSGQSGSSATRTITLSPAYFTFDLKAGGHGVGIGHSADVEGVMRIGMDVQIDGYSDSSGYDRGNFACVDNRLPQNDDQEIPQTSTWGNGLFFYPTTDFNTVTGNPIYQSHGYIRGISLNNGYRGVQVEAQRYVNDARKTTALNVAVDNNGYMHATLANVGILMAHGYVRDATTPANSYKDFTVTFPFTYPSTPHVIPGMYSTSTSPTLGSIQVAVYSISTTGATIRVFNNTNSSRSPGFYWLAIGS